MRSKVTMPVTPLTRVLYTAEAAALMARMEERMNITTPTRAAWRQGGTAGRRTETR